MNFGRIDTFSPSWEKSGKMVFSFKRSFCLCYEEWMVGVALDVRSQLATIAGIP